MTAVRTLVAGIGNVFCGDDGFGVEVVRRLAARSVRSDVRVEDFGIRGIDLAYALADVELAILVDAAPRGRTPGTLVVLEPDLAALPGCTAAFAHGLVPVQALALARALAGRLPQVRVVGCEPLAIPADDELAVGLSPAVADAVERAVVLIEALLDA